MIRSVLAVLAGIAALTAASFAIEAVANPAMMRMFPQALPDEAALSRNIPATLFMIAYTSLCVAAGGYVTAWVARRAPLGHGLALGIVQEGLTILAMMSFSDKGSRLSWIATLVMTIPLALRGALIRAKQTAVRD
jgi:hypothetical protein